MCDSCGSSEVVGLPTLGGPDCSCNAGCGGCNDCGSSCGGCSSTNLIGSDCISIDKTNPNNRIIKTECNPIVKSTDGTVSVTPTTVGNHKEYDLSVQCQDKKVAVSPDCPAGYLEDQITVTGALTIDTVGCKVQLGLDEDKLALIDKDEKVKVREGCDAKFLEDVIEGNNGITVKTEDCKIVICPDCNKDCSNCRRRPKGTYVLNESYTIEQPTNQQKVYYFCNTPITELDAFGYIRVETNRNIYDNYISDMNGGCYTLCRNGRVAGWMNGNQEQNKGVHGTRALVYYIKPNGTTGFLCQSRYSGTDAFLLGLQPSTPIAGLFGDDYFGPYGSNDHTTSFGGQSLPNGGTYSMGRVFERLPLDGYFESNVLPSGTKFVFMARVSTVISGDNDAASVGGQVSILGNSEGTVGGNEGFAWGIRMIDDECECMELQEIVLC